MTIPEIICIGLGFYVEIFWLLRREDPVSQRLPDYIPESLAPAIRDTLVEYRIWIWALLLVTLAFLYEQLPFGDRLYLEISWILDVMAVSMLLIVLYFGVLGHAMLPRINLQKMFIVNLVVLLLILLNGYESWPTWLLLGAILPTGTLCILALWPRKLPLELAALLYFWYLLTLLALTFLNLGEDFFNEVTLNSYEVFIFAVVLVFLCLHVLLALRFLIIVLSLILPRNRPLLTLIMPRIIQDESMPRGRVLLLLMFAIMVLLANQIAGITPTLTLTNLIVLAIVQYDNTRQSDQLDEFSA